jgi:hypothetical protein
MKKLLTAVLAVALAGSVFAGAKGRVNILDFKSFVKNPGTAREDWHPAFEKAVEQAYKTTRILYVPAGKYQIMDTIDLWKQPTNSFNGQAFKLVGDGRFVSTIIQKNKQKNCVDWTGKTYKGSMNAGTIENICLSGGKITLNIKWHNQFTLRSCYIAGGSQAGIHAEGWSNRFLDIIVRHCYRFGIYGYAHFNDVSIRDGYFSRCGVGIMLRGARGVRISGIGFEHCANTSIYMGGCMAISVVNCYFEGDGMGPIKTKEKWGFPSSIAVDYSNKSILIEGCIFRGTSKYAGQIRLSQCKNGRFSNNLFQIHHDEAGVMVAPASTKNAPVALQDVKIQNNNYCWGSRKGKQMKGKAVPFWYYEKAPGMIANAVKNNCVFEGYQQKSKVMSAKAVGGKHDASQFN